MGANTKIEWADHTFNPWIGCQGVGPGCDFCYAEARDRRFNRLDRWGPHGVRELTSDANWKLPLKWNREAAATGTRPIVFSASLADVFDNKAPEGARARLFKLVKETPHLFWVLVTKRLPNVQFMLPLDWGDGYPNVMLMLTVCDQGEVDRDLDAFTRIPAAYRGLSIEPMLGPIERLDPWIRPVGAHVHMSSNAKADTGRGLASLLQATAQKFQLIHWVIVGGEDGPRPMHPDWARTVRDICAAGLVPFCFKQWGTWDVAEPTVRPDEEEGNPYGLPVRFQDGESFDVYSDGEDIVFSEAVEEDNGPRQVWKKYYGWQNHLVKRVKKKDSGRLLDGRTWDEGPHVAT